MDQLGNICRYDLKERLKISINDKFESRMSLPSPCTAFSQCLSVNSLRWRIQGEQAEKCLDKNRMRMRALLFEIQDAVML